MAADVARRKLDRLRQTQAELEEERAKILTLKGQPAIRRAWEEPKGLWGILTNVQHISNARRQVVVAFTLFLIGGFDATLIRLQLIIPNNTFLNAGTFDQTFTMHGTVMTFMFAVPFLEGVALMLLPLILGARAVPWPRLTAFVFWSFLFASVMLEFSWLVHYGQLFGILPGLEFGGVPDAGWTQYVPLSTRNFTPNVGTDFWLMATTLATVGAVFGSVLLVVSVLKMRAPGMSIQRLPLFAWSILVMGLMIYFAFIPQIVATAYLEFDRKLGTHFFDVGSGPLLWQHLLWTFGNPDEYIEFIPAAGIISTILPVVLRQRINGYTLLALTFVATGFISFGLWVVHMFTVGLPPLAMTLFMSASLVIAIPAGVQVMAWLQTIWRGRLSWNTPFLFMLGFLFLFVVGGIAGVMLALIPFDWQMQDSYFVVAHLHYMVLGGLVFPIFAAIYYWFPKFTGKLLDERLGRLNFWLLFIGANTAFFPQYLLGLDGMQRRIYFYPDNLGWEPLNFISTIGQFLMILGVAAFILNVLKTWRAGENSPPAPWQADTLEWATESPAPAYGFQHIPIVYSRHPLWDQENVRQGHERVVKLVNHLAEWPTSWRAQIVVSALAAEPQAVVGMATPSIWPLITVMGMTVLLGAFLFQGMTMILLLALGALISLGALIGWHWPTRRALETEQELEALERTHGVQLYPDGSPTISLWAVSFLILGLAIALATAIFVYLYIRYNTSVWPPDGSARPELSLPSAVTVLVLASAAAMYWAQRSIRRDGPAALIRSLAVTWLLGLAAFVIQVLISMRTGFTPSTNAYGSVFDSLAVFAILLTGLGLLALLRTVVLAWRGHLTAHHHQTVTNNAMFWYFVVVAWLAVAATLYLTPYLA